MVPLAPALSELFPLGFPFSALEVPRGDHTLKDSQQSVVHHERAPSQQLERRQVSHGALHNASSTVRSLLSVHTLRRVSSSRTRSSSRSSLLCLCSCSLSQVVDEFGCFRQSRFGCLGRLKSFHCFDFTVFSAIPVSTVTTVHTPVFGGSYVKMDLVFRLVGVA